MKILATSLISILFIVSLNAQTVTDIDGNSYPVVKIGNQAWMAKNLAVTKAPDGTAITSFPYLGVEDSVKTYGRMYDWENARKACPSGWHLPGDEEWTVLVDFLGGPMVAGGKIKETGTKHWKEPNKGATNETGFTALPNGYRTARGKYINFKNNTREAIQFYQSVFGGKLTMATFKEFHASQDPAEDDLIMHADLVTENGITLMASDTPERMEYRPGTNISVSLSGENEAELTAYYQKLSAGGTVTMPLEKAIWGDSFGMLIDKFDITWLVNIAGKKE